MLQEFYRKLSGRKENRSLRHKGGKHRLPVRNKKAKCGTDWNMRILPEKAKQCVAETQPLTEGDCQRVNFSDNCILDNPGINYCPADEKLWNIHNANWNQVSLHFQQAKSNIY